MSSLSAAVREHRALMQLTLRHLGFTSQPTTRQLSRLARPGRTYTALLRRVLSDSSHATGMLELKVHVARVFSDVVEWKSAEVASFES